MKVTLKKKKKEVGTETSHRKKAELIINGKIIESQNSKETARDLNKESYVNADGTENKEMSTMWILKAASSHDFL